MGSMTEQYLCKIVSKPLTPDLFAPPISSLHCPALLSLPGAIFPRMPTGLSLTYQVRPI